MQRKKAAILVVLVSASLIFFGSGEPMVKAGSDDLSDTLLLYDATDEEAADNNFRKISEYYGLKWAEVDLSTTTLTDALLRDESGQYYQAIGIDVATLALWLDSTELAILEQAVDDHGANLLVTGLYWANHAAVQELTDGEVTGATQPSDSHRDFIISDKLPEVSREFTGQTLTYDSIQYDYALTVVAGASHVEPIISSTDNSMTTYPIFIRYKDGMGSVFVHSRNRRYSLEDTEDRRMEDLYRDRHFAEIVPLMMFIRHSAGDEAWHNNHDFANLTIDDPSLTDPYGHLGFDELLTEMEAHNFHTTIAFIPKNYELSEPDVVNLFLDHPDRYSLVFHGNNHDNGLPPPDNCPEFTPDIPREAKEADLVEAKWRMQQHEIMTGIPCGMVMIFPCRLSGLETLELLKEHNFSVTVNIQSCPIGATASTGWDRNMYPASLDYSNFATVVRHHSHQSPYLFNLFRDKPVFMYEHDWDFVDGPDNMNYFNPYADAINGAKGEVEWKSLGYIAQHLYLEKRNDDGSIDVKMYGNNVVIENETDNSQIYHVKREETLNVPIYGVTVDGIETGYSVADGILQIDLEIAANSAREILIIYGDEPPPPPPTYPVEETSFTYEPADPLEDEAVTFSAIITPSYAHPPITYTWQFDDGAPAISTTSAIISHTYDTAGTYTLSVTAANPYGQGSYSQTIAVAPTYPVEEVSFVYQPVNPLEGEEITFTATITPSYAHPPITYTWQFGDSTAAISTSSSAISHTYDAAGVYTVSVTATNLSGQSACSQTGTVAIHNHPQPDDDYYYVFLPLVLR
jgi:PKD repeat protein